MLVLAGVGPGAARLEWQPTLAGAEPWRWWTAAWVHLDHQHRLANLAGLAAVGVYGWAARCSPRAALAWLLAWPLTHLGLLVAPQLERYAGMSGVLHAGVVVASLALVLQARGAARMIGLAVLGGLVAKLLLEAPWAGVTQRQAGWAFPVAVAGHLAGSVAGAATALVAWATGGRRQADTIAP